MERVKGTLVIGLDPGVTCFGAVAIDDHKGPPVAWATFNSKGREYSRVSNYLRVTRLAQQVVAWANSIVSGYRYVVIVVEKPIYNHNAKSFEIQWRLVQQVMHALSHVVGPDWFLEVSNGTVKKEGAGSGKASKLEMVLASHFDGPDFKAEDAEALADAEAIANCWYTSHTEAFGPNSKVDACHQGPVVKGGV